MIDSALFDVPCPVCDAGPLELCTVRGRYMESTVHFPRRVRADVPFATGAVRSKLDLCMAEKHAWIPEHTYTSKDGRELCRLCRDARKERKARPVSGSASQCINGHDFTPENTYMPPSGVRRCRICTRVHASRARKKANT